MVVDIKKLKSAKPHRGSILKHGLLQKKHVAPMGLYSEIIKLIIRHVSHEPKLIGNKMVRETRTKAMDKNGDFWFNTEYRYSVCDSITLKSNKFYTRHESIGSLDGKNTSGLKEYLSIAKDSNNNLGFATYRSGVWKYDGTKVTHYPVKKDSNDITIFRIYKDNNGYLWLGTHDNGAYKFNGNTFEKFKP